jgi:hypothetical protein
VFGLTPCRLLALAVLETAVRDAHAGSIDARYFLEEEGPQLIFWCGLLGVQTSTVRKAAADPEWHDRVAKAKAELAREWLSRSRPRSAPPASTAPLMITPRPGACPASPSPPTGSPVSS